MVEDFDRLDCDVWNGGTEDPGITSDKVVTGIIFVPGMSDVFGRENLPDDIQVTVNDEFLIGIPKFFLMVHGMIVNLIDGFTRKKFW